MAHKRQAKALKRRYLAANAELLRDVTRKLDELYGLHVGASVDCEWF